MDELRLQILNRLQVLPDGSIELFKKMYSHENLDLSIEEIVNNLDSRKLNNILYQVKIIPILILLKQDNTILIN